MAATKSITIVYKILTLSLLSLVLYLFLPLREHTLVTPSNVTSSSNHQIVSEPGVHKESPCPTCNYLDSEVESDQAGRRHTEELIDTSMTLKIPDAGVYFGAFADFGPYENNVNVGDLTEFQGMVGKKLAWGYFSDNWFTGIDFPMEQVEVLKSMGITPYIRIMPRINFDHSGKDSPYGLERIANGIFDESLRKWAREAMKFETPLMIEFGTEVNGEWFPWNGRWNGGGALTAGASTTFAGPSMFIEAYRHIIDLFREEGVRNVTWIYHVNAISAPREEWNDIMSYYPGDDYIDWIGVSVYGPQSRDEFKIDFDVVYAPAYRKITEVTDKPIAIVEMGVAESRHHLYKRDWIDKALKSVQSGLYPNTKGVAYWHSQWFNKDGVDYNLRLDSSPQALDAFKAGISNDFFLSDTKFHGLN